MAGPADQDAFLDLRPGKTAEDIARLYPPPAFYTVFLDGAAAPDKAALLAALAAGFKFPAYFGHNWDALLDCLRSLQDWLPAKKFVLAVADADRLLAAAPAELENFRDVAAEAARFQRERAGGAFTVVYY